MLKVGLTGGIGSGKTTVAKIFEVLGIPVYKADLEAKRLMHEDPKLKESIKLHFGEKAYTDGMLNRKWLAESVFNDKEKLSLLNSIVHPATIQDGIRWMDQQRSPYTIKETALLFESNLQDHFDYIVGVSAPLNLRIERTMERDKITRHQVEERMKYQMDESIKMDRCNTVIVNDEMHMIVPQVLQIHAQLLEKASTTIMEKKS
jgi:dephospho-CoA kinase